MIRRLLALLSLVLLASGCHHFTIVNGKTPMETPADGYDERLHSSVAGDIVIIDKPVDLATVCPQGWAQIDRRVSGRDGLVNQLASSRRGGGFYRADSLTVRCAAEGSAVAPRAGADAPPPEQWTDARHIEQTVPASRTSSDVRD
jgi:hypothetical protein